MNHFLSSFFAARAQWALVIHKLSRISRSLILLALIPICFQNAALAGPLIWETHQFEKNVDGQLDIYLTALGFIRRATVYQGPYKAAQGPKQFKASTVNFTDYDIKFTRADNGKVETTSFFQLRFFSPGQPATDLAQAVFDLVGSRVIPAIQITSATADLHLAVSLGDWINTPFVPPMESSLSVIAGHVFFDDQELPGLLVGDGSVVDSQTFFQSMSFPGPGVMTAPQQYLYSGMASVDGKLNLQASPIPEPQTWSLLGLAAFIGYAARRKAGCKPRSVG